MYMYMYVFIHWCIWKRDRKREGETESKTDRERVVRKIKGDTYYSDCVFIN